MLEVFILFKFININGIKMFENKKVWVFVLKINGKGYVMRKEFVNYING